MPDRADGRWDELSDAYGSAADVGRLLSDRRCILSDADTAGLWSRLYHQGEIYTASYAAVPRLLAIQLSGDEPSWNVLSLIAAIHVAHIEGRAPRVPAEIHAKYVETIGAIPQQISRFLVPGLNELQCRAILAVCAAATGNTLLARVLLELTPEFAQKFEREWRFDD